VSLAPAFLVPARSYRASRAGGRPPQRTTRIGEVIAIAANCHNRLVDTRHSSSIPSVVSGSYPVRTGNRVGPLVDGVAAFGRIGDAVAQACSSVWTTVAFISPDFRMPETERSFFDLLDEAVDRGLDVRVLFWRPEAGCHTDESFGGTPGDRQVLAGRKSRFGARWDLATGRRCQHQKSWLIDAGTPDEAAFVGGMNLSPANLVVGHRSSGAFHDVYVELAGPAVGDVHHNFVQRWNEASERDEPDGTWGDVGRRQMQFPTRVPLARGEATVQVQRTVGPGRYRDGAAPPDHVESDIGRGEHPIFDQYRTAIASATRSIYVENQSILAPEVVDDLAVAVARGVTTTLVVPLHGERAVQEAREQATVPQLFDTLAGLAGDPRFTMVGLEVTDQSTRIPVHVHSKLMVIDDAWATVGSCNLRANSLFESTELNLAVWDDGFARALRVALMGEHLAIDVEDVDELDAHALLRRVATKNAELDGSGSQPRQGSAVLIDPAGYGSR